MKARIALIALFLLAACQPTELDNENQMTPVEETTVDEDAYTLTLTATKCVDTKALELSGNKLNAYWVTGEKVGVYVNGVYGGSLSATAATSKSTTATLSGSVKGSLAEGDVIMLLYPDREDIDIKEGTRWSYAGQDGALSARFDYATAELAVDAVDEGSHTIVTTGSAEFQNEQSIYRFGFRVDGTDDFDPADFTINADKTGLVRSVAYQGSNWRADYRFLSVTTPAAKPEDHLYYLSLRNVNTDLPDIYFFRLHDGDSRLYLGRKPVDVQYLGNGKFLSAPNVTVTAAKFSPKESGDEIFYASDVF